MEVLHTCRLGFRRFVLAARGSGTCRGGLRASPCAEPRGGLGRCPARGFSSKSKKQISFFKGLCCEKQGLAERGLKGNGCELQRKCLHVSWRAAAAFPFSFLPLFFHLQGSCEESAGRQQQIENCFFICIYSRGFTQHRLARSLMKANTLPSLRVCWSR